MRTLAILAFALKPFKGHSSLASIAPIYCATNPKNSKQSVHLWSLRLMPG